VSDDSDGYSHLQAEQEPEHYPILTGARDNGNLLHLRCKCMAQYRNVSSRFKNYDWLVQTDSLAEIKRAWREHLGEKQR
jgi:hypothetical protein